MSHGIRVWDDSGNVIFDSTRRLGKILGQFGVAANSSGTFSIPLNFGQGDLFAFPIENNQSTHFFSGVPDVWITDYNVIHWGWVLYGDERTARDSTILYGVY